MLGSAVIAIALGVRAAAEDWPQFLGPERSGVYRGPALADTWGPQGPKVVWRTPVGQGFSGPVVAQGHVILFHRIRDQEVVEAIDARTGTAQWRYAYPTSYRDDFGFDEGPRAVPVVANGNVYTFGAEGQLHAIDLETGTRIWSVDTMQRFGVAKGFFGAAGSPLVEDGRVLANVGGPKAGVVAFEAKTGKVLWTATEDGASYSSAVGATIAGRRHAIFLTRAGLVGLDPATGEVRFQRPWRARSASLRQRGNAARHRRSDLRVGRVRTRRGRVPPGGVCAQRALGVERRAVESLCDQRLPRRVSLRLPRGDRSSARAFGLSNYALVT